MFLITTPFAAALACLCVVTYARAAPVRPVNISNSWVLVDAGSPVFYRYFRDRISWYEADAVCQFHHGNLVTVETPSQFDAVRSYLKELNIVSHVWIGLMRSNENVRFIWSNTNKPISSDGYWGEVAPKTNPLCAAADPAHDFRWHALGCGGPEIASFVCELPVPPWALGAQGCLLPSMPALTIIYLPESTALEMTADCGSDGTRRIACKGHSDQSEMIHQLTCPEVSNKLTGTIPLSTSSKPATKSWMWSSNTIETGDYDSPTRHRRETEGMLSTSGGFPTTKEISTSSPQKEIKNTENTPKVTTKTVTEDATTQSYELTTKIVEFTTSKDEKTPKTTQIVEEITGYPINQGQLFSLNGTIFDILELNETILERNKNPEEITTKLSLSAVKKDESSFTTVSYYKEAPPTKTSAYKQPTIETQVNNDSTETKKDLSSAEQDKTFIKAIESSNSLIKLNRTSRKELPLVDFNVTSDENKSEASQEEKNVTKEVEEEKHEHRVVEITLTHDEQKKGTKLYVTTKKHDKLKMGKSAKFIENDKSKTRNVFPDKIMVEKVKSDEKIPSEVHEMLQENFQITTMSQIDPKLTDLNFNKSKNVQSENVPIKLQEIPTTELAKEENTEYEEQETKEVETKDEETNKDLKTTEEPVEPIPEEQPRPNRNRVLTRPQRRSFYPYFFSRVLG